jgi:hypothetical protein
VHHTFITCEQLIFDGHAYREQTRICVGTELERLLQKYIYIYDDEKSIWPPYYSGWGDGCIRGRYQPGSTRTTVRRPIWYNPHDGASSLSLHFQSTTAYTSTSDDLRGSNFVSSSFTPIYLVGGVDRQERERDTDWITLLLRRLQRCQHHQHRPSSIWISLVHRVIIAHISVFIVIASIHILQRQQKTSVGGWPRALYSKNVRRLTSHSSIVHMRGS